MSLKLQNIKGSGGGSGGNRRKLFASSTATAATLLLVALLVAIPWTSAAAVENDQNSNNRNLNLDSSSSFGAAPSNQNDIYIDDEGLEGSGSRGEVRDDLEKEDDEASGSGFGDDDEDSTSSRSSLSSSSSSGGNLNVLRGGSDNLPGSVPIGKDNSKSSSSSSSSGSSSSGGVYSRGGEIIETGENDLDLGGLPRHHVTPTEGSINHHDNTQYGAGSGVLIMNAKNDDRTASFFAQPGILAAVIGGAVVGLLCAILVVMFIVYRMRKKDEGSYALDEPKRSPTANTYAKNVNNREFYA
uniref:syndecan isoform X2 n=1 Tax=Anopheles coluzzii TaxID=1518534 RepID=UPI0020FF8924|nr:syndecan isoform X2 [Anopheles coluzzii]